MDGIDGLAGSEGVFVAAGLAVLMRLAGAANLQWMCWILAACCLGFLCWNMPHARIFMGDVGSGFLGYVFGAILLMSSTRTIHLITVGSILLAVFITDTLVTLMRSVIRRTRWYEAHCEHAFQHAALKYGSHFKVTMGITAINLLWLFPIAFISCMRPGSAPLMLIAAYIPLIGLVFYFHAGTAGSQKGAACVNNEFKASEEVGDQP